MSRYDGLIIPRSYSEYINKTDAATLSQALQLSGVMDNAPTANSNHPVKSSGILTALNQKITNYVSLTNEDLNTITTPNIYRLFNATCTNAPAAFYESGGLNGVLEVYKYNDNSIIQRINVFMQGIPSIATRRRYQGGLWGDWYIIYTKNTLFKTKDISSITDNDGKYASSTINIPYNQYTIIGIVSAYTGPSSVVRYYEAACDLASGGWIVYVFDENHQLVKNTNVSIKITYIETP